VAACALTWSGGWPTAGLLRALSSLEKADFRAAASAAFKRSAGSQSAPSAQFLGRGERAGVRWARARAGNPGPLCPGAAHKLLFLLLFSLPRATPLAEEVQALPLWLWPAPQACYRVGRLTPPAAYPTWRWARKGSCCLLRPRRPADLQRLSLPGVCRTLLCASCSHRGHTAAAHPRGPKDKSACFPLSPTGPGRRARPRRSPSAGRAAGLAAGPTLLFKDSGLCRLRAGRGGSAPSPAQQEAARHKVLRAESWRFIQRRQQLPARGQKAHVSVAGPARPQAWLRCAWAIGAKASPRRPRLGACGLDNLRHARRGA
jgi:hypothetical protein